MIEKLYFLLKRFQNRLTYNLSDTSAIKEYLKTKHNNDTEKLTSFDIRKILNDNTRTSIKIIIKVTYKYLRQ